MAKTKAITCFILLCLAAQINAQMNAAMEVAGFRYEGAQVFVEVYYAVPLSVLKFLPTASGALQAQVLVRFSVFRNDSLLKEEAWKMEKVVASAADLQPGQAMVDVVRQVTPPGNFRFAMNIEDLHMPGSAQTIFQEVALAAFPEHEPSLSAIELASSIKNISPQVDNRFYKNGLEVIPKPDAIFGTEAPLLYYYLETYNLPQLFPDGTYRTRSYVLDAGGQPVPSVKPRLHTKKTLPASVEVGMFNVAALPSGIFDLHFDIVDSSLAVVRSRSQRFYVYHPGEAPSTEQPAATGPAPLSPELRLANEAELDEQFARARYVATKEEVKAYKDLTTADAKRQFLSEFWLQRDPTPGSAVNELKNEYQRRLAYANEQLREYTREGWKTDRGRVHIIYGPANDVERYPNNPLSYAYEIWHYDDIEGGVIFVFVQLQGMGEYVQLHSTKRGEPQTPDWQEQIEK
jgi:GWxTD domain-containing protein